MRSEVRGDQWLEEISGQKSSGEVCDLGRSLIKGGLVMRGGQWSDDGQIKSVIRGSR
jgi:hypothetical protein